MIILERKKILSAIGVITIFIFTYIITGLNINNVDKKSTEAIATVALPVNEKVIVIDAGHGVPDEGAESSRRNNRGRKQFKNSIKSSKSIRTIRSNCNINPLR